MPTLQHPALDDVRALHAQGVAQNAAGHPRRAAQLLGKGLAALEGAAPGPESAQLKARLLLALALSEAELGGAAAGLPLLAEAERVAADAGAPEVTVLVHGQRGLLLLRQGLFDPALAELDAAVALTEHAAPLDRLRILLNRGGLHLLRGAIAAARRDVARCVALASDGQFPSIAVKATHNLGYLEFLAGNLPLALDTMQVAQRIDPTVIPAIGALDRARVLIEAGLHRAADEELAGAAAIFRRDRLGQDAGEVALARAECALLAGDPETARRFARQARMRFRARGNERWMRSADRVLVSADLLRGRVDRNLVRRSRELAEALRAEGLDTQARAATFIAAEALLELGRTEEAAAMAAAAPPAGRGEPITARLHGRYLRARLHAAAGQQAAAAREVRTGLRELAAYQARFGSIDLRTASAVHGRRLAGLGVRIALDARSAPKVFTAAEHGRATSARLAPVRPPADEVTADLLAELRRTVEDLRGADGDRARATALGTRRRELERRIAARSWSLAGGRAEVEDACTLGEVRAELGADTCLVEYVHSRGRLHAVRISTRAVRLQDLGPAGEIDALVRRVRADLDVLAHGRLPDGLRAAASGSLQRSVATLDARLLGPLGIGSTRLVIVPTGELGAVPWTAFASLRGVPVEVAPSATAWLRRHRVPPRPDVRVVGLAGPDLLRADEEVRGVRSAWPSARALTGAQAGRAALAGALARASVLHVAAHGTHQLENPLFSSIRLADGTLFAHELDQSATVPEHVVLSACELGLATVRPGDEALGLTSVLLNLGTRCVISGVARVHDDVAADTMARYHARLAAGTDAAAALAQAIAEGDGPAPFVCFGASWAAPVGGRPAVVRIG